MNKTDRITAPAAGLPAPETGGFCFSMEGGADAGRDLMKSDKEVFL